MKLVVAATGASGSIYLQRLLEQIDTAAHEIHLVLSGHAKQVAKQELGAFKIPKSIARHCAFARGRCFFKGATQIDRCAARNALEFDPRAQHRHSAGSRRDRIAGNSVFLQPPDFTCRSGRHGGLADSGSNRLAERARLSLGRSNFAPRRPQEEALKIEGWRARWLIAFGFYLLQVWARTLRYEIEYRANVLGKPVSGNYIGALWHNRLLLISFVLKKFFPDRPGAGLISASRDGDLIADVTQRFGFDVVRGSSSRMGAAALLELSNVLNSGHDVLI